MTIEELAKIVKEMRDAQKLYFRTHAGLEYCKRLERRVDETVQEIHDDQGRLFK